MHVNQILRTIKIIIFTLFLGIQMYFALSYYQSKYPWDERFAWRMFSTVRKLQCVPQAWIASDQAYQRCPHNHGQNCQSLRFTQDVHMVWYNLLKRGRTEVIQAWVQRMCQRETTKALYFSLKCPIPKVPHPMHTVVSSQDNACDQLTIQPFDTTVVDMILNTLNDESAKGKKVTPYE